MAGPGGGSAAPRLYLVTPRHIAPEDLAQIAERLLATGSVACLRLDLGQAPEDAWRRAASHLQPVAHAADVALVLTGHETLVRPLGLDGVHLVGQTSGIAAARKALGKDAIVGAFAGLERHAGMSLAEAGTDYVAVGPFAEERAVAHVAWWAEMIETPVVAEGGVTPEIAGQIAGTADFVVPDLAIWTAADPVTALMAFAEALAD